MEQEPSMDDIDEEKIDSPHKILGFIRQKLVYKELQEKNPKENPHPPHPTMCFSTHRIVEAGQVGWRQAEEEVEQGQAKGEGEQRGDLRPGHLRQAAHRGAQVQADHALCPLRATQDQRVAGSQGHQGPDGEGTHQDGVNPLQPADLHQGDKHCHQSC
uniref:Uncharacterized protein n=1 Tax=Triticum urartu TaxID=4572 RepID=A0A8R7RE22_TRIUA